MAGICITNPEDLDERILFGDLLSVDYTVPMIIQGSRYALGLEPFFVRIENDATEIEVCHKVMTNSTTFRLPEELHGGKIKIGKYVRIMAGERDNMNWWVGDKYLVIAYATDEGIVIDVWDDMDNCLATTFYYPSDFEPEEDEE